MNRYQFIGHLGADAEVRHLPSGSQSVIAFSVAITEKYTDRNGQAMEKTYWVRCSYFKPTDKLKIAEYLRKGTRVLVEGKPEARAYVTPQNEAAASLDVIVANVELLGQPQQQQAPAPAAQNQVRQPAPKPNTVRQPAPPQQRQVQQPATTTNALSGTTYLDAADDDLPF